LTLGCIGAFIESLIGPTRYVLEIALTLVAVGSLLTAARRLLAVSSQLRDGQP
jgi:hypothetical protein